MENTPEPTIPEGLIEIATNAEKAAWLEAGYAIDGAPYSAHSRIPTIQEVLRWAVLNEDHIKNKIAQVQDTNWRADIHCANWKLWAALSELQVARVPLGHRP